MKIEAWVTPEQKERIERAAKESGCSLADIVRSGTLKIVSAILDPQPTGSVYANP